MCPPTMLPGTRKAGARTFSVSLPDTAGFEKFAQPPGKGAEGARRLCLARKSENGMRRTYRQLGDGASPSAKALRMASTRRRLTPKSERPAREAERQWITLA